MRGTVAKRLRKQAYGDMSLKEDRYYKHLNGGLVVVGERRTYQRLKKEYKEAKRGN